MIERCALFELKNVLFLPLICVIDKFIISLPKDLFDMGKTGLPVAYKHLTKTCDGWVR